MTLNKDQGHCDQYQNVEFSSICHTNKFEILKNQNVLMNEQLYKC